jgi:DNA-binding beta-propeller fold protein YncE
MPTSFMPAHLFPLAVLGTGAALAIGAAPALAASNLIVPKIVANLPTGTGTGSYAVAIDTTLNRVYIGNVVSSTVDVIDGASDTIIATIPITNSAAPTPPLTGVSSIAIDTKKHLLYACTNNGTISVVDGVANRQLSNFIVNTQSDIACNSLVLSNTTGKLYFAARGVNPEIDVVDPGKQSIIKRIPDPDVNKMAIDQSTNKLYVSQYWQGSLWVIDGTADELRDVVPGTGFRAEPKWCWLDNGDEYCKQQGTNEDGVEIDEELHHIYVFNNLGGMITTVDATTNTVVHAVEIGDAQFTGAVDPTTHAVYALSVIDDTLGVIDGTTGEVVKRDILVGVPPAPPGCYFKNSCKSDGDSPSGIGINPVTGKIYVADIGDVFALPKVVSHVVVLQAK